MPLDLDAIAKRWDLRPDPDDGSPRAYRISTVDVDDVAALVAELRAAREATGRLADVVEVLRHNGCPYRWHQEVWNRALLLADNALAAYDKATGGK